MLVIKPSFDKYIKDIKTVKKSHKFKNLKISNNFIQKYVNKTMLVIINFPKINEKISKNAQMLA